MENGDHLEPEEDDRRSFSSYTWETSNNCYDDQGQTDLILAATLGKNLLEQNEELSSEYYKVLRRLETLTQDNFELRNQLDVSEEASNNLISELQEEVCLLREKLERSQNTATEQCLKDEIDRLNNELQEASDKQNVLKNEAKSVNDSLERERNVVEEQSKEIKTLKHDLSKIWEQKVDLEKFAARLQEEKDSLTHSLDTAVAKIQRLEMKQHDHESIIRTNEREMEELKTSNHYLLEKLELWSMSHSSSPTFKNPSLMSELESSDGSGENSLQRSKVFDIINEEDEDIEEFEFPAEFLKQNDDERERDKHFDELESVTSQIVNISSRIKEEFHITLEFPPVESDCQKLTRLKYVTEELNHLLNVTVLDKNIDLLNKSSQTERSNGDFSDYHETLQEFSEPWEVNLKLLELEEQSRKDEIVKKGLYEKLQVMESRLEKVARENKELLLVKCSDCKEPKESNKRKLTPRDRPTPVISKFVKEENNNSLLVNSIIPQLEQIEGMIKHILETKDPPKKLLRRS